MKAINAFLLIALIYAIGSADFNCLDYVPYFKGSYVTERSKDDKPAFSLDFCQSTSFSSKDYYSCCFLKWTDTNDTQRYNCFPVNHTEMADIDIIVDYLDGLENAGIDEVDSLDCSSSYLYGSLLLIFALLF